MLARELGIVRGVIIVYQETKHCYWSYNDMPARELDIVFRVLNSLQKN